MSEAIGMIETRGYTGSIEATDAMVKAANVSISKTIPIGGGLITVICKGDVASVKAAVDAGSRGAGGGSAATGGGSAGAGAWAVGSGLVWSAMSVT